MEKRPLTSIGILGGMGPAASAEFYRMLVDYAQHTYGADQDTDFPEMYIYSIALAGFDETGFTDPERVKAQLVSGIQKLSGLGAGVIAIPCNTVHAFIDDMRNTSAIPIISIIESVADEVIRRGYKTVGLLTSDSARRVELYEKVFVNRGITFIRANDPEQLVLNNAIHHVMSGAQGEKDVTALKAIDLRFENAGAEAVVLGCTELPLAIRQSDSALPLISSTDVLAKATLARVYGD
jgi:aspartate racemase